MLRLQNPDAGLTLTQAAARARVSKQLVLYWTRRKEYPLPRSEDGLIRLADLLEVERDTRLHRNSHRGVQLKAA